MASLGLDRHGECMYRTSLLLMTAALLSVVACELGSNDNESQGNDQGQDAAQDPARDSGSETRDAGQIPARDSGSEVRDAGQGPESDAGRDAGSAVDAGQAADAGGAVDAGSPPDAGTGGAAPSAGCGKTSTLSFGTVPGESGQNVGVGSGGYLTIQSGSDNRGFALRLPDNYDKNNPYWLVFGFHWNGGTSKEVDTGGSNGYISAHFGLQKLSKNGAIFVAPQGLGNGWPNTGGRDLKFVDDMIKLIEDNYCVDTKHIFANGFSYGGGMSYAIACNRAKVFRGVAIYEGAQLSGCDGGKDPIAYWQMAGLTDGVCSVGAATPMRDKFVKNNGCTAQNPPQPPNPPPYLSSGGHICTNYSGCSSGYPLRWCVHQSGHGNAIVDGTSDLYNSCATPPKTCSTSCPCTWVPEDVWSFFTSL
jgi:poly(3-hydroxybutyrate) depolymerase